MRKQEGAAIFMSCCCVGLTFSFIGGFREEVDKITKFILKKLLKVNFMLLSHSCC